MTTEEAFAAWGAYDHNHPFPVFGEARERGPVHRVTLADGHVAWLAVRYDEARSLLNDPRLSKNMQAAMAASPDVVADGLPGPGFARHMLVVDPPDHTRLRSLVSAAFSLRRIERLRPHEQTIIDELLDELAARGPDSRVDWWAASPSRCRSQSSASSWACRKPTASRWAATLWFSTFPPNNNPIIDGTHTIYALVLLVLMFLHAGNRLGSAAGGAPTPPRLLN
jgi:hypothetical protein